jgi:hypothetical protein
MAYIVSHERITANNRKKKEVDATYFMVKFFPWGGVRENVNFVSVILFAVSYFISVKSKL